MAILLKTIVEQVYSSAINIDINYFHADDFHGFRSKNVTLCLVL